MLSAILLLEESGRFTQHEEESHLKQVVDYQLLLREMGMPNVKGYVYYGALEKLVEV